MADAYERAMSGVRADGDLRHALEALALGHLGLGVVDRATGRMAWETLLGVDAQGRVVRAWPGAQTAPAGAEGPWAAFCAWTVGQPLPVVFEVLARALRGEVAGAPAVGA